MKEIHVWEFHPTKTQIKLKDGFRKTFFDELYKKYGYEQASDSIAKLAKQYKIRKIQNRTDFYTWKKGYTTKNGKIKQRNMPLWALIELSKLLSNNNNANNVVMKKIEKNIEYYAASGKGKKLKETKFPIRLTPELTSIIFHLCGDGHIGLNECCSHYRQMNPVGLNNFLNKLVNIFGKFEISKNEFEDGKIIIPKVITDFYQHYFKLNSCYWDVARIPQQLKNLPKPFLVAGLCSFIIDEGHIEMS